MLINLAFFELLKITLIISLLHYQIKDPKVSLRLSFSLNCMLLLLRCLKVFSLLKNILQSYKIFTLLGGVHASIFV